MPQPTRTNHRAHANFDSIFAHHSNADLRSDLPPAPLWRWRTVVKRDPGIDPLSNRLKRQCLGLSPSSLNLLCQMAHQGSCEYRVVVKGGSDPSKRRDAQNRVLNRGRIAMISVGEKGSLGG